MAREPDQLAGRFETENTGGVLTGFLADEDVFDRSSLWRLGSWGAASVAAVIVALYSSQSAIGLRRDQVAAADLARQAQQIQLAAKENQNEARRLASAVDTLNGDRDRLYSRVTVLEQGLDSVTGAIARQAPAVATPQAAVIPVAATESQTAAAQTPAPAPAVTPVATMVAKAADKPSTDKATPSTDKGAAEQPPVTVASVAPKASNPPAAMSGAKAADKPPTDKAAAEQPPATVASIAPKTANPPAATPAPLVAAKSMMGPPDAAAAKLIEPEKSTKAITSAPMPEVVASAPPADDAEPDASQATLPRLAVQRTEFGVDLGGANSVNGLRALWRGLLKSRSNAVLTTMRPIIVIRESNTGLGMQLRLVAGPLDDAAAAAKICAGLIESERTCETAVFDGQRLAMKADEHKTADKMAADKMAADKMAADKPAADKPAASKPIGHRRGFSKRASNEEPARKPDAPSTLSAFFSRR
jgi:hypothetical protein